jgi:glycolate oxidase iron-sulfur subunit
MAPLPAPDDADLGARISALADTCVLCGLCLPHCPTYVRERTEGESPRGRIMLMKALAEARLAPEPSATAHLDHCLGCRNCERVCPAQVPYGTLLQLGRAAQRGTIPASSWQRIAEWLLPRRRLLDLALRAADAASALLPPRWRRLPRLPAPLAPEVGAAAGTVRGRVALFAGCLGSSHDANTVTAAIRLLRRLGYHVDVPAAQTCCGSLHAHAGASERAQQLAAINRHAFDSAPDAILTLASGCHEAIVATFAGTPPVRDLLDFLADDAQLAQLKFRAAAPGMRVALHLPCTQRNVTRNAARIAPLLARIPGLALQPLPDGGCCGAAGAQMLTDPARADAFRAPLLDALAAGDATTLCTSNIGCRLHLARGLEVRASPLRALHPVQLLAEHLE